MSKDTLKALESNLQKRVKYFAKKSLTMDLSEALPKDTLRDLSVDAQKRAQSCRRLRSYRNGSNGLKLRKASLNNDPSVSLSRRRIWGNEQALALLRQRRRLRKNYGTLVKTAMAWAQSQRFNR